MRRGRGMATAEQAVSAAEKEAMVERGGSSPPPLLGSAQNGVRRASSILPSEHGPRDRHHDGRGVEIRIDAVLRDAANKRP